MTMDRPRTLVAATAAGIATLAALAASADGGMSFNVQATWSLTAEAAIAALLALWPATNPWRLRRRVLAGAVAAATVAYGLLLLVLTSARAACGCGNAADDYRLPTLFGIEAFHWVVIAVVAYPILMAAATSPAPDRPVRRTPSAPTL
jgi:hypothetical protein